MPDNWQVLAAVAAIVAIAYLLILWIAALVWTYRDIQDRTRDHTTQVISVLMVLIFNLPGLLLYMVLRPKSTLAEMYDRRLEAEALLQEIQEQATCPACRRKVESEFVSCPYCRATLRTACDDCGRALMSSWVMCPYCGMNRVTPAAARSERPADSPPAQVPPSRPRPGSTARYTPPASSVQPPPSVDA